MIHPIIDEFYSENPSHSRSSQFAQTKGQTITNSKKEVITGAMSGSSIPGAAPPKEPDIEALQGSLAALKSR